MEGLIAKASNKESSNMHLDNMDRKKWVFDEQLLQNLQGLMKEWMWKESKWSSGVLEES